MKAFTKWNPDLKLFLDYEELGDYISKNIKDINTIKKYLKYGSTAKDYNIKHPRRIFKKSIK